MAKKEQLAALEQKRIDLAFNRLMRLVPGLVSETLLTEPLFVAIPGGHYLCAQTAIPMTSLEGEPAVVFPTGFRPSFIDVFFDLCNAAGFTPNVVAEVADVVHGIALVATGGGVSLVPRSATNLRIPGVVYRPLYENPMPSVDLCCIHRRGDESEILRSLLMSMRETASKIQARNHKGIGRR